MHVHEGGRVTLPRPGPDPQAQAGALGSLQPLGGWEGSKVDLQPIACPDGPAGAQAGAGKPGPRLPHMTSVQDSLGVLFRVKLAPEGVRPHFLQTEKQGSLLSSCAALAGMGPGERV